MKATFTSIAALMMLSLVSHLSGVCAGEDNDNQYWDDRFGPFGISGTVGCMAQAPNGDLYVGGNFITAADITVNNIAKWDGRKWSALGTGVDGLVCAIAVHGTNVYVGGTFTMAGGVSAKRIARWDGASWSALGAGMNDEVRAVVVSPEGVVYAGGGFTKAGGVNVNHIARWNGTTWASLGEGVSNGVNALALDGGNLYAGGWFQESGDLIVNQVARWDGSRWYALGTGATAGVEGSVWCMAAYAGNLYVGGIFTKAGGGNAKNIARWNGSRWSKLGSGMPDIVFGLAADETGVYAGGSFLTAGGVSAKGIARWDGTAWNALGTGIADGAGRAIVISGSDVYVGGNFSTTGDVASFNVARWDGSRWFGLGGAVNGSVRAVTTDANGDLVAAGSFSHAVGLTVNGIARWNGAEWYGLGNGLNNTAHALASDGVNLYVGGEFTQAGGVSANRMAKWNGATWSALGTGLNGTVRAVALDGANVYVGGEFTTAGGVSANYIAKWNGSSWSALGAGMNGAVWSLATDGLYVYAGGSFSAAGGVNTIGVARWNGTSWTALGTGMNGPVFALATNGYNLFAAGNFNLAGGVTVGRIAKWNGSSWSALGAGLNDTVWSLATSGNHVYVGGSFTTAGGTSASRIAHWNGATWTPLGIGVNDAVFGLHINGTEAWIGGLFNTAGDNPSYGVGRWMNVLLADPPAAPANLTASAVSSSRINLSWSDLADDEQGFAIERASDSAGPWSGLASVAHNVTTYANTGLDPAVTWYYRVRAYNAGGPSPWSNTASATTHDAIPNPPGNLTATAVASNQINLFWTDNSTNEQWFRIERALASGGPWTEIAVQPANLASYADTNVSIGVPYYYRVRATNGVGASSYSNTVTATLPGAAPVAPTGLVVTPVSSSELHLTWTDNGPDEMGFAIERSALPTGPWVEIGQVAANVTSYQATGLTACATFSYRIRGFNYLGYSAPSNVVSATTLGCPPVGPDFVVARPVAADKIVICWNDIDVEEDGFTIRRALSATGPWKQVGEVGPNATCFVNTGLNPSTKYFYQVGAFNAAGRSKWAGPVSATTQKAGTPDAPSALIAVAINPNQVNLSWTDNSNNERLFRIQRRVPGGAWALVGDVASNVTSYADTSVAGGVTYEFRVRARNNAGNSKPSLSATVTTPAPIAMPVVTEPFPLGTWEIVMGDNEEGEMILTFETDGTLSGTGIMPGDEQRRELVGDWQSDDAGMVRAVIMSEDDAGVIWLDALSVQRNDSDSRMNGLMEMWDATWHMSGIRSPSGL